MAMDQATSARRSTHSEVRLSRNEVIAARQATRAEIETSAAAVNGTVDFVAPAPKEPVFEAIEVLRLSLLNVLGSVRCVGIGVANSEKDPCPEISTAFGLLEFEIQRIATALEKISLRNAIPMISTAARRLG